MTGATDRAIRRRRTRLFGLTPLVAGAMYSPGFFPNGYLGQPGNGGYDQLMALARRYSFDPHRTPWNELRPEAQQAFLHGTDEVLPGRGDYGAVRGFFHPRGVDPSLSAPRLEWNKYERLGNELPPPGEHRWSRHRAWLRLVPATPAPAYDVTLEMGAPFPSTLRSPRVRVRANGAASTFTLTNEIRPYTLRVPAPPANVVDCLLAPAYTERCTPRSTGASDGKLHFLQDRGWNDSVDPVA